ncbi:hypothetical protein [Nocardia seriolae]|uniref:hypothetical protein n=1 Tax=Nocardia seriolae TaxID=37332 RepID=UPI00131A02E2|nr:hypothetical protein [Nocardia seriolae]QOW33643.1 hypothetical protein IMZ23_00040 [Nocardia seriolae]QUN14762.1 hypothetical protein KEC46_19990 [Nocardia seriolae]WKY54037.1 hypothetical protein Q5P07_08200 [Nocardia seriolae]WNJ60814.1 hypothetical protein RMO66_08925 [Nocardia seriolae]
MPGTAVGIIGARRRQGCVHGLPLLEGGTVVDGGPDQRVPESNRLRRNVYQPSALGLSDRVAVDSEPFQYQSRQ